MDAKAACHGLLRLPGLMPSSTSACAASASLSVSCSATLAARSCESPLAAYMSVSSASSSSGVSRSSPRSFSSSAFSVSRWELTETYSPTAMLIAPAVRPATPAVRIVVRVEVAPATPKTMPAVDTMPSLPPRTPARSQFNRREMLPLCGSWWFSLKATSLLPLRVAPQPVRSSGPARCRAGSGHRRNVLTTSSG